MISLTPPTPIKWEQHLAADSKEVRVGSGATCTGTTIKSFFATDQGDFSWKRFRFSLYKRRGMVLY